jgi:hypothetical protein
LSGSAISVSKAITPSRPGTKSEFAMWALLDAVGHGVAGSLRPTI